MAGDTKDVELRIRAVLEGKKTFKETIDSLNEIEKAQDSLIASSKKGGDGPKKLAESFGALSKVADELLKKSALFEQFRAQSETFQQLQTSVDAAREAQTRFAQTLSADPTKKQKQELDDYGRKVTTAEKALERFRKRVEDTAQKLREQGIETASIAEAQRTFADALARTDSLLSRQNAALKTAREESAAYNQKADAARRLEQAEADRLATLQKLGEAQLRARGAQALDEENARLRDADALTQKLAAEKAAAKAAEKKQQEDILAFQKAIGAQKEREIAQQREAIAAQARLQQTLREAAAKAVGDARGASTLARPQSVRQSPALAGTIGDILNPSAAAVRSLDGVEAAISRVEKKAATAIGPVRGYKDALNDMAQAQRGLSAIASQIDGFQRQIVAVRAARSEFVRTRSEVAALAAQMRSGIGGEELIGKMQAAKVRLEGTASAMGAQVLRAREMREALRAAGIDTSNLAAVQGQLQQQAQRSVEATNRLRGAVTEYGAVAETVSKKAKGFSFFNTTGERTTLSYMQRLRGEVLGMATAFVGLQAAAQLARDVIQVTLENAKIQNRLSIVFDGDARRTTEEFNYLRAAADGIGVSFTTAANGYTKFAIAAKNFGFDNQTTRRVFEQLTIATKNAGLSNEEYEGTLKAVEQMMSKGVIQAEELKGQLGDRLPGAVTLLAQSMGKTTGELLKMMEQGGVTAQYVVNLANTAGESFGKVQETAATRLQVAIARQENAARDFKQALGEAGFIEAYTQFLQKMTVLLNSPEGANLARTLGDVFTGIVKAAQWAAENIELLKAALLALAGIKILGFFTQLTGTVGTLAGVLKGLSGSWGKLAEGFTKAASAGGSVARLAGGVGLLTMAFKGLVRAIPILGTAITLYELGQLLFNKASDSPKPIGGGSGPVKTGRVNVDAIPGQGMSKGATGSWEPTPDSGAGVDSDTAQLKSIQAALDRGKTKLDTKDKASRMTAAKQQLEDRIQIASEEVLALKTAAETQIKDTEKRAQAIAAIDKRLGEIRTVETRRFNNEQRSTEKSANDKRLRLAQEVAQGLETLADRTADKEAKIDPNATFEDRMKARVALAGNTYREVENRLNRLDDLSKGDKDVQNFVNDTFKKYGVKDMADARARVTSGRSDAEEAARKETAQKEVELLEKRLAEAQAALDKRIETTRARVDNGGLTRDQGARGIAEATKDLTPGIEAAAQRLREFATQYRDLITPDQFDLIISKVDLLTTKLNPSKVGFDEVLAASEKNLSDALDRRAQKLAEIEALQKVGAISGTDAANQINAIYAQSIPTIKGVSDALMQMIELRLSSGQISDEERAKLEALLSKYRVLQVELGSTAKRYGEIEEKAIAATGGAINSGLDQMSETLGKIVTGQQGIAEGFESMGTSVGLIFAKLLQDIALYIIKLQIAKALAGSSNETIAGIGVSMGGALGVQLGGPKVAPAGAPAAAQGAAGAPAAETAVGAPAAETAVGAAAGAANPADMLTQGASEAAAIQTAAAATAATTTETAAVVHATTVEGGAVAAEVIDKGSSMITAVTDQGAAATAATTLVAGATTAATAIVTAAQTAGAIDVAMNHSGGIAGGATGASVKSVNPSWFRHAKRYHGGGIPGLKRDEVPAVLEKGEEVITRNDPRHVLNGGTMGGTASPQSNGSRFVLVDDRSKVAEAMAGAEGEGVTMVHLKRNLPTIKSWLK